MLEKIKSYLPVALAGAVIGTYLANLYVSAQYEKELAELITKQATEVTALQQNYKADYEKREKALIASYLADRDRQLERMRNLESKLRTRADVATLTRERNRCLGLVVEGSGLVEEGRRIIEAERGSVERQ